MKTKEIIDLVINKLPMLKGLTKEEKDVVKDALYSYDVEMTKLEREWDNPSEEEDSIKKKREYKK